MDLRRDDNQFLMDMIVGGDASNINIYLNMSGDGIDQSEDDADQQPVMLTKMIMYISNISILVYIYIYITM
jgi:hypothetical protein